ncbi:hypothetical protein M5G27_11915 [Pseudomonas shahriarae]|jgi:hypothetical protein|uniref:Uncharacterized protein n=1 Tax=Pseudomonas shahriarae TaxID=2745512 RepID=A0A9X4HCZ8_9PSED|nr:hypothetical protein [Pseudomonas shahriarae]MDD1008179.1 hypothetical protein [Pseudomonas shahriarae]
MGDTDTPDFNKARGFLIGFSVVVFLLWYFGADLSSFKLMGNEIKLQSNTKSAWMILALINVYFLFRYYQRLPRNSLVFDEVMNNMYDHYLKKMSLFFYGGRFKRIVLEHKSRVSPNASIFKHHCNITLTVHEALVERLKYEPDALVGLHSFDRKTRTQLSFSAIYKLVGEPQAELIWNHAGNGKLQPNFIVVTLAKSITLFRGAFIAPWLTDNVFPLVIGAASTIAALAKWYQVNFL